VLQWFEKHIDMFRCPRCSAGLSVSDENIICLGCQQRFETADNIPLLFWPTELPASEPDVTAIVQAFYENTPFPNYDDFDSIGSLVEKARRGLFAKLLDDQIPFGAGVLEIGCGTGQLSNFLSVANRTVVGTDICLNSLRLAQQFKEKNRLGNAHFLQMNLFRPIFRPNTFDLVISNGVLHHTANPFLAFKTISALVRPRGYILVGLYHRYGRLVTDTRRLLFRLSGDRLKFLDPNLRKARTSAAKRQAWFMDQYKHPHESKHTIGEVLGWLRELNFEFVKSIPRSVPFRPFLPGERLFEPEEPGNALERLFVELGMMSTGSQQGGFFIVIGRKC
jgi:SAM-dependent methyltransferase